MNKRILLDTHIWLWHVSGDLTLSSKIRKIIDDSALQNTLFLSAISVWEVATLVNKQRITLNTSCQAWVDKSLALPGISLIALSPEIAIESCALTGEFHGDPADRIIIATAKIENLCLISRDKKLNDYCAQHDLQKIEG